MPDGLVALRFRSLLCAMAVILSLVAAVLWSALISAASGPNRRDAPRLSEADFAARWEANAATIRDLPPAATSAPSLPPHVMAADQPQPPSDLPSRFQRWSAASSGPALNGLAASEASPAPPVGPPASPTASSAQGRHWTARSAHPELCAAHGLRREYYHRGGWLYWRCTKLAARRHRARA